MGIKLKAPLKIAQNATDSHACCLNTHATFPLGSERHNDAHFLYAVGEGVMRISSHQEDGDRQILAFMWPGDLFGLAENGRYMIQRKL